MSNIAGEMAPDWAMRQAKETVPCRCATYSAYHAKNCAGNYRAGVAQSLREAEQRGYRRGVEAAEAVAAEHACTDTVEGRTGGLIVEGIRALVPKETNG